jgi:hypothetical protein
MVFSTEPAWSDIDGMFTQEYRHAVVYADLQQETVLHEGALRLLANGWIELPSGRLLSPDAVNHVDTYPEQES